MPMNNVVDLNLVDGDRGYLIRAALGLLTPSVHLYGGDAKFVNDYKKRPIADRFLQNQLFNTDGANRLYNKTPDVSTIPSTKYRIPVSMRVPTNLDNKLPYVVVYFHGNRSTINTDNVGDQHMVDSIGAPVITMEYPGYGSSKNNIDKCVSDHVNTWAEELVDWLLDTMKIPSSQIVLQGFSIGSAIASKAAAYMANRGDSPRFVILEHPFASVKKLVVDSPGAGFVLDKVWQGLCGSVLPFNTVKNLERLDPLTKVLVFGTIRDELLPPNNCSVLMSAISNAKLYMDTDVSHGTRNPGTFQYIRKELEKEKTSDEEKIGFLELVRSLEKQIKPTIFLK